MSSFILWTFGLTYKTLEEFNAYKEHGFTMEQLVRDKGPLKGALAFAFLRLNTSPNKMDDQVVSS